MGVAILLATLIIKTVETNQGRFELVGMSDILESISRGDCPPLNRLSEGETPVITTTEERNGVDGFYN